jgi:hypothetical protein
MAIEDWIPGFDEDYDELIVRCRRCGEYGLSWGETHEGWRLYNHADELHVCKYNASDELIQLRKC